MNESLNRFFGITDEDVKEFNNINNEINKIKENTSDKNISICKELINKKEKIVKEKKIKAKLIISLFKILITKKLHTMKDIIKTDNNCNKNRI